MRFPALRRPGALVGLLALAPAPSAWAEYPDHTITMVIPFAAGGPSDVLGRIVAQSMSQALGQQVAVENVTGAGGTIGAARVAKAAPDGYTLVIGNLGTHAASVGIYQSLAYDPAADFAPVILVGSTPMVLITRKDFSPRTLSDLAVYARTHKGTVSFGSAGPGSIAHLSLLLFDTLAGVELQHVPYRGLSQAENDLMGGQIDGLFDQVITAAPHIAAGEVNALAVTAPARAAAIPAVPTSIEAGMPELQTIAWTGVFLPRGTPASIVDKLNKVIRTTMEDKAVAARMAQLGSELPPPQERSPQALGALVRSEIAKWVPLIRAAGVRE